MSLQGLPTGEAGVSIDEAAALAALDGQRELLKELAGMFIEDAPLVLEDLHKAVDAHDATVARRAVHTLKGLVATFFAKPTTQLAQQLEDELASGSLTTHTADGIEELEDSIQRLIRNLEIRGLTS